MENKFKPIKLETTENKPIVFDTQEMFNQEYINDLTTPKKYQSSAPTYNPRKLVEQFSLVDDGSEKSLYVNINNTWVKVGTPDLSGYVPTSTTVNGHTLSSDVVITADDIGVQILGAEASDTLQYSLDTERTVNGNVGGVCKSIKLNVAGTIRIKWDSHIKSGFSGLSAYLQKNGTTIQAASSNMNTAYETYTFDTDVSFGDTISVSGENNGSVNYTRYFRNFRIYYTPTDINNTTLTDTSL